MFILITFKPYYLFFFSQFLYFKVDNNPCINIFWTFVLGWIITKDSVPNNADFFRDVIRQHCFRELLPISTKHLTFFTVFRVSNWLKFWKSIDYYYAIFIIIIYYASLLLLLCEQASYKQEVLSCFLVPSQWNLLNCF